MSLLVLAYPKTSRKDYDWVQQFRKLYDDNYKIVEPHFTIIFPVSDIPLKTFVGEIREKTQHERVIPFSIDRTIAYGDILHDHWHIFLIPGKGYRPIVELHDQLYSGTLKRNLQNDIPYIPHLTIGTLKEAAKCKELSEQINSNLRRFSGMINQLDIISFQDNRIKTMDTIVLKSQ